MGVSYVQIVAANIVGCDCESLACYQVQKCQENARSTQEESNEIAVSIEMTGLKLALYIM